MGDEAAGAARPDRALGPAGVLLLVLSIALVYLGGLTLLGSAMAPPIGPEDEVAASSWAVSLVVGLVSAPVALVRRTTLTRLTLLAIGSATACPCLLLLVRHVASGQTTVDDALLVVSLGVGTLAIIVASMSGRARRLRPEPDASTGSSS
ncbi:hypothetical protein [Intrasporangium sp. YIM S08009]|uniref:hypothetical protein n=1 Tax=Intrasporangium zincisolvens TaxID=3080018 RepID=UPI002B057D34|nr:hypothetical protein [Intrasporangium sp. YIM S08009]